MNQQLKVACDLFLDLKLYRVPHNDLESLKCLFPNVHIVPVNIQQGKPPPSGDAEIYWGNRISPEIIATMPNLKWIHFGSVGVNRVQAKEVLDRNIIVTNSRDTMTGAVAAAALSMMLALARGLHHCWRLREDGNLTRESYDRYFDQTYELEGQVCLIVGYGQIGKRLAASCEALGMRVDIISRSATTRDGVKNGKVYQLSELELAGREADYVVNLLPLTNLTTNVFDRKFFSAMKKSAFFINLGRGESVCEDDLIDALKSGTIGGAGLDVFEKEPLAANSELWKIPEVIITPHIGGLTNRYWERQTKLFAENLERYINGKKLVNVVDMGKCY